MYVLQTNNAALWFNIQGGFVRQKYATTYPENIKFPNHFLEQVNTFSETDTVVTVFSANFFCYPPK